MAAGTTSPTSPSWTPASSEPQRLQKQRSRPGEDAQPASRSSPCVRRKLPGVTPAQVAYAALAITRARASRRAALRRRRAATPRIA